MIVIDGVKYACERCIRGHRVTKCSHSDGPLVVIKPKGRPSTVCEYCKAMKKNHNSNPTGSCVCGRQKKLEQKKNKLREEKRAKKIKEKALLQEQNGDTNNNLLITDDNFSQQSSLLSMETNHAISCSCYDTGICNCHKKRKNPSSNRHRIGSTHGISKRRNSNSSFDVSSKFLGSHQSDYMSLNSGFDNSSLYSHDSFSNAVLFPNSNNPQSKISPNSQVNETPGLFTSQSFLGTKDGLMNTSPADKNLSSNGFVSPSSNNINTNIIGNEDFFTNMNKNNSHLDTQSLNNAAATSMNVSSSFGSINNNNIRKNSSFSSFQNLDNDYMHLNEHRKTHWQLHHNNSLKNVESLHSFSTNNNNDLNNRHRTNPGMNLNFLDGAKHAHGLLDNVGDTSKYSVNTYLETVDKTGHSHSKSNSGSDNSPLQYFQNKNIIKNSRGKSGNSPLVPSNLSDRNNVDNNIINNSNNSTSQRPSFSRQNSRNDERFMNNKFNNNHSFIQPPIDKISPSDFIKPKEPVTEDTVNNSLATFNFDNEALQLGKNEQVNDIPMDKEDTNPFNDIFLDSLKNSENMKTETTIPNEDNEDINAFINANENSTSLPHLSKDFLDLLNKSPDELFGSFPDPDANNQTPQIPVATDSTQQIINTDNTTTTNNTNNNGSFEDQNAAVLLSLRPGTFGLSNLLGTIHDEDNNSNNTRNIQKDVNKNNGAQLL